MKHVSVEPYDERIDISKHQVHGWNPRWGKQERVEETPYDLWAKSWLLMWTLFLTYVIFVSAQLKGVIVVVVQNEITLWPILFSFTQLIEWSETLTQIGKEEEDLCGDSLCEIDMHS